MMLRFELLHAYAIGFMVLTTVHSEGYLGPMNTSVVAGSRATLNCSSSDTTPNWTWRLPNNTSVAYTFGNVSQKSPCIVNQSYASSYAVSAPSVGSSYCNLIILNATSAQAGSYSCSDGGRGFNKAMLLVLDSGPQCSTDAVNNTVAHPGQVTMNCSVQYNSSSGWIPNVQWSPTGSTFSGSSGTTTYSTLTYNTGASTPIPSYSCAVVYNSSVFVDVPSCSTNSVTVLWCPMAVTISGAPDGYVAFGTSLTCSASGNPSPTYQWFNSTGNLLTNSPALTVLNQDTYTCTASNNANGSLCSTSVSQRVDGSPPPPPDVLFIVLGVLLGVAALVIILMLIILCKKRETIYV